jgi:hypothetical protein
MYGNKKANAMGELLIALYDLVIAVFSQSETFLRHLIVQISPSEITTTTNLLITHCSTKPHEA